ncbi:MAG: type II toxin-antitoxin system Phd/YefM family antitoxin [Gemmatimonadaceae bacterium]
MKQDEYSLYEAKAKLSAIVRRVREGHTVVVTVHGEPAVEIRPVTPKAQTFEDRYNELVERGEIIPATSNDRSFPTLAHRPGALKRFLADRNK